QLEQRITDTAASLSQESAEHHTSLTTALNEQRETLSGTLSQSVEFLTTQADENHAEATAAIADVNSAVVALGGTTGEQLGEMREQMRRTRVMLPEQLTAQYVEQGERDDERNEALVPRLGEPAGGLGPALDEGRSAPATAAAEVAAAITEARTEAKGDSAALA